MSTAIDEKGDYPVCMGCETPTWFRSMILCDKCKVKFCEDCAAMHYHACENCGGTGIDPGSLHEPEECDACEGSKLSGESLDEIDTRKRMAATKQERARGAR